ncbi:MAG: 16S rRNA (uracil(1498)-N(3))-methyltransferase [Gammaproteobacteria bacterium]|nr:16S rRNA (uracil(1498)-N(3))-methyltransferase [Gammaproteobacteria bacterium]
MKRIYVASELNQKNISLLDDASFHYLFRVLRCRDGEKITVFNGDGNDYIGTLQQHNKKSASIHVTSCTKNTKESPLHTILIQAISKGDRMDFAIQKAVELGVTEIYPVQTEFSAVKLNEERQHKKQQHWQSIIQSACEQSQRSIVPKLHPVQPLESVLNSCNADKKIVLHPYKTEESTPTLSGQKTIPKKVALVIGPEGGLSQAEVDNTHIKGFTSLQLGTRILRTETATISALTLIQYLWGDYD